MLKIFPLLLRVALVLAARRAPAPHTWLASIASRATSSTTGFVFTPADFGGDPSGETDSTKAVQAALAAAAAVSVPGAFIGNGTNHAGATVDLRGGAYQVSSALWVGGDHGGGLRMCCGMIRAAPSFPRDDFIVNVGNHVEDVTFEDLQLDCAQTGGGLHTSSALRVHISRAYVHGFTSYGVRATQGHEVHLTDSFLGQYWWGEDGTTPGAGNASGTAVLIDGQDHWIDNIIIFSAAVGVEMRGGAAVISNSHIYNGGGPSLLVSGHALRVVGSYFDFDPVVLIDPLAVDISHCFFLGAVGVELRSSGHPTAFISGLQITHNQFVVGNADPKDQVAVWVNESAGFFQSVNQTTVALNVFPPATYGPATGQSLASSATEARLTTVLDDATDAVDFNFRPLLTFDCSRFGVTSAEHSIVLPMGTSGAVFPATAMRATGHCQLQVVSNMLLPAGTQVSVTARQV